MSLPYIIVVSHDNNSVNIFPDGKHTRFILTNYYYISCHNSFNFFKDDGSLFLDEPLIEFHFIFNSDRTDHILHEIDGLVAIKNRAKTYFKTNHNRLLN